MKTNTSFETMTLDVIDNTIEYVTTLIKAKELDFSTVKSYTDIRPHFTKVTQSMIYPTEKFDTKTGERIMKTVASVFGKSTNSEILKEIYQKISTWYYTEYEERFDVEPVYTKQL